MFQVSRQVDYATQLVQRLAELKEKETLSLRVFSNESNISFLFLQKIARALKKAGIVDSTKGSRGGYFLCADMRNVSLKTIFEAIEGPYGVVDCAKGNCSKASGCTTKNIWLEINNDIMQKLEQTPVVTK